MKIFEIERSKLPEEVTDFVAVECMECEYEGEGSFSQKYFRTEPEVECESSHNEAVKLLKPFGYSQFSVITGEELILSVSKCPNCGSEDIVEDY